MDKESRVAFIISQAAMLNAEIAMLQAANQNAAYRGCPPAYDFYNFYDLVFGNYSCLEHNSVIAYLRD